MTRQVRQRFVVHTGSTLECTLDLQDYGIPTKKLPENMGGDYQLAHFLEWFDNRQKLELQIEEQLIGLAEERMLNPVGLELDQQIIPTER